MKKRVELDVDFIGGGQPPTKEEFLAISEYIKAQKAKRKSKTHIRSTQTKRTAKQPS
jgi:hypothetical protein